MAITGYDQIIHVDTAGSLPPAPPQGMAAFAYAEDTMRHYMFSNNVWYQIPNTLELSKKTAVYIYDQGVKVTPGTPQTGDTIIWHDQVATSGGNATFYVTSDRTNAGTAICSSLRNGTVDAAIIDSTGATARGDSVITSNKQITVPITKQVFNGIVLLSTNILGSQSMNAAPNGTIVKLYVIGVAA